MNMSATKAVRAVRGLKPSERLVLLELAAWARPGEMTVYRSQSQLAADLELSVRTVRDVLARLVELDHLAVAEQGTGRRTTVYTLTLRAAESASLGYQDSPPLKEEDRDHDRPVARDAQTDTTARPSAPSPCEQQPAAAAATPAASSSPAAAPATTAPAPQPGDPTPAADNEVAWQALLPRRTYGGWGIGAEDYAAACALLTTYGAVERFKTLYATAPANMRKANGSVFVERLVELATAAAQDVATATRLERMPLAVDVLRRDEERDAARAVERHARWAAAQRAQTEQAVASV